MEDFLLSNGVSMPKIGLGVYQVKKSQEDTIIWALQHGYRRIDTAALYHNEALVADAIKKSGLKREDVFITTKLWNSDHGREKTLAAFQKSLERLDTDYVDLYLIHWPSAHYAESWQTITELYHAGRIRAIGVANFEKEHLEKLAQNSDLIPMVDQVQTNPNMQQRELHRYLTDHHIQHEAWGPFGHGNQNLFRQKYLVGLAAKYSKTTAQIILRWNLQRNIAVIPKSVHPDRLQQNLDVFNFALTDQEMDGIASLDKNSRRFVDPNNKLFLWLSSLIH
ncbi:aldo/keto reductase [Sporolactobacillus vineae]|uniref:aldo/keto reductase n=1 Tax=Sporolactobacillus vineae TaxID=444463 RepID=UPI000289364A|nr:aldo/keto reductase [Sporolactobacillus vineae]